MNGSIERILWIDVLKGIGITLVVLGHRINNPQFITLYIYSFHMPLFFFISGLVNRSSKKHNYKGFATSRSKQLLVPYFFFSFFYLTLNTLLGAQVGDIHSYINGIKWIIYGTENLPIGPMWFLPCLFVVESIYWWINKYCKGNKQVIFVSAIALSLVHYYLSFFPSIVLPWNIEEACYHYAFYVIGSTVQEREMKFASTANIYILLILSWVITQANPGGVLNTGINFITYILQNVCAILGILLAMAFAMSVRESAFASTVKYLGRNSIVIYLTHYFIFECIHKVLDTVCGTAIYTKESIVLSIGFTVATVLLTLPVIRILNRYCPFVIGKSKPTIISNDFIKPEKKCTF